MEQHDARKSLRASLAAAFGVAAVAATISTSWLSWGEFAVKRHSDGTPVGVVTEPGMHWTGPLHWFEKYDLAPLSIHASAVGTDPKGDSYRVGFMVAAGQFDPALVPGLMAKHAFGTGKMTLITRAAAAAALVEWVAAGRPAVDLGAAVREKIKAELASRDAAVPEDRMPAVTLSVMSVERILPPALTAASGG